MNAHVQWLERECQTFARYLVGVVPSPYVCRKYAEAHVHSLPSGGRFDDLLVGIARRGSLGAKLADSYARVFAPRALLRKKLVVLLAILETSAPSYRSIDEVDSDKPVVLLFRIGMRAAGFCLALVTAAVFLLPTQLVLGRSTRSVAR